MLSGVPCTGRGPRVAVGGPRYALPGWQRHATGSGFGPWAFEKVMEQVHDGRARCLGDGLRQTRPASFLGAMVAETGHHRHPHWPVFPGQWRPVVRVVLLLTGRQILAGR